MAHAAFDVDATVAGTVGEEVREPEAKAGDEEVDDGSAYGHTATPSMSGTPLHDLRKRFVRTEMMLLPLG